MHGKMTDVDHVQVSSSSWIQHHTIVLSWDLLSWISVEGGIPQFFTGFITTPLYISPDVYHTQNIYITEYSLKTIFLRN